MAHVTFLRVGHDHSRTLSYGDELDLARTLIAEGDRAHALHHCVAALSQEPHRREWRVILSDLLTSTDLVAKLEAETFYGAAAALAIHHHDRGNFTEALETISYVIVAVPQLGFQAWFATWLAEPGTRANASAVQRVLSLATTFGIGRIRMLPAEQAAAEELAPIAEIAAKTQTDPKVLWLASATLRRAGRYREAIAIAERVRPVIAPDLGVVALGLALRANRDFDRATHVFDEFYRSSREVDFLHEKKRVLADAGKWAEAVAAADELERISEIHDENQREHAALRANLAKQAPPPDEPPLDLVRRRAIGHGALLPMLDATANGIRNFASKESEATPSELGTRIRSESATLAISGDEGASNRLCLALMFAGVPDPRRAKYSISGSALRSISDQADQYSLWKADGDVTVQALPPPPDSILDWVERLALFEPDGTAPDTLFQSQADFLDMWRAATQMPVPEATAREWVAATIYPRMPVFRVGMGPDWVYRWQVAALIGLAHSEREWAGTARRDAFLSLLRGSIDWPLAAAIRVVAEVALNEPAATAEIRDRLIKLSEVLGRQPNTSIAVALHGALDALPYVADHYKDALRTQNESDDEDDPDPDDEDEPEPEGKNSRPWWKFWQRR